MPRAWPTTRSAWGACRHRHAALHAGGEGGAHARLRRRGRAARRLLAEARQHAYALAEQQGLCFVHPYDDEQIAAGQGTLALEMLAEQPDLDLLVVAIGGGGLIAGVATAAKGLNPDIEIIGVQTQRFPSMFNAVRQAELPMGTSTIAEGIAVTQPGAITQEVVARLVDDMLLVDEGDIEQAVLMLLEIEKTLVEGAGAAGWPRCCAIRSALRARRWE